MQVHVVERGLDLVHQVEGRRPGAEHGEQVRERGERALATREQREPAHGLARRPRFHLDAGVQQVVRIGEHDAPGTAREQHREQLGEVAGDVGERGLEDVHDLLVDRLDHARQLAPRVAHVVELLLQELVPLDERFVLRQRERVDRAHEPQLALELARPGRQRRAVGTSGIGAAIATSGSQSNSRRTFSIACSSRRRISASSISSRPTRSRSSASCCSAAARSARRPSSLAPAARAASDCSWRRRRRRSASRSASAARSASRVGERVDRVALVLELARAGRGPALLRRGGPRGGLRTR